MSKLLPEGWMWAPLDSVRPHDGPIIYGILQPGPDVEDGVRYVRPTEIVDDTIQVDDLRRTSPEIATRYRRASLSGDDVVFTIVGSIGKVGIVSSELAGGNITQSSARIRPDQRVIDPRYLKWTLKSPVVTMQIEAFRLGTAVPRLNLEDVRKIEIPLAPRLEQNRILDRLEPTLARVRRSKERLDKIARILKRFRQAILAAACSGTLTADWRGSNRVAQSASEFLTTIEHSLKPVAARQEPGEVVASDLPDGWARCSLGQLFNIQTGATPLRTNRAYHQNGTIPWVKTGEVQNCDIWAAEQHITPLAIRETNAKVFPEGTLLIAMYGEGKTRGQVGRLRIKAATNQASAALLNPALPEATNEYTFFYALGQYHKLRAEAVGGNQPNLSLGVIKRWEINLPPPEEQEEIVRRTKEQFALIDRLEERYNKARRHTHRLPQAILAKAFRGELVPTEAELARREGRSYETAEELLARIKGAAVPVTNRRVRTVRA